MNIFRSTLINTSLLLLTLGSCSIAGSWVYERLDNYLANYFFEFADFSEDQREKIRSITKDYQVWFSKSELPKINNIFIELKNLNIIEPEMIGAFTLCMILLIVSQTLSKI